MKLIFIGFGVVGQGLAKILQDKAAMLQSQYGFEASIVGVATGSKGFLYDADGLSIPSLLKAIQTGDLANYPESDSLKRDFADAVDLIQSCEADAIIEISPTDISTAMPAAAHFDAAIASGKHIVTANKGPVALGFQERLQAAHAKNLQIRYEATLMAGTPTISLGLEALAGCTIESVRGIVNGTTNYILSEMESGMSYQAALKRAQELGYAETDPTADVEGYDAAAKVLIMLNTYFGVEASLDDINVNGITSITPQAIQAAAAANERYKLIASANKNGGQVNLVRLPISDPLANIKHATNALTFKTDLMGDVTVIGAGAGQKETGFALLADLLAIHRSV